MIYNWRTSDRVDLVKDASSRWYGSSAMPKQVFMVTMDCLYSISLTPHPLSIALAMFNHSGQFEVA